MFYTAHNLSDKAITGVSTYNVAPQQAGYYFNKIQCFCFEEQKLRPGMFVFRLVHDKDFFTPASDLHMTVLQGMH